jgi:hypothetical protein
MALGKLAFLSLIPQQKKASVLGFKNSLIIHEENTKAI